MVTSDLGPVENRVVGGDVDLPFACRHEDGTGDPSVVIKHRAIQCALSRICGVCGLPLVRPIAFVATQDESDLGEIAFPPCHRTCATEAASAGRGTVVVTTGGFDLLRPTRRGGSVAFHPNSVVDRVAVEPC